MPVRLRSGPHNGVGLVGEGLPLLLPLRAEAIGQTSEIVIIVQVSRTGISCSPHVAVLGLELRGLSQIGDGERELVVASWADPDRVNLAARRLPTFATWQAKPLHHPSDVILRVRRHRLTRSLTWSKERRMSPIVLHIPHLSRKIPENVLSTFLPDDAAIERDLLAMTDHLTDEIVAEFRAEVDRVIFSRQSPCRRSGKTSRLRRRADGGARDGRNVHAPLIWRAIAGLQRDGAVPAMETYYCPHHARLENAVEEARMRQDHCLIVDVHDFSSVPLPHELDRTPRRPPPLQPRPFAALQYRPYERAGCAKERAFRKQAPNGSIRP